MKYAETMRQNFINFLRTRTPYDLMTLYRYAWKEDGKFDTDGVIFQTFDDMASGDLDEFHEFVFDIVKSGGDIVDDPDVYYSYTVYGYKLADEDSLYDKVNITALAEWLIDSVWYCFPTWTFANMVDVKSGFDVERYCKIIAGHI